MLRGVCLCLARAPNESMQSSQELGDSSTKLELTESYVYCSHQSSKILRFAIISSVIALGRSRFLCLFNSSLSNSSIGNLKFQDSQCRLSRGLDHIVHFQPLKSDLLHTSIVLADLAESLHLRNAWLLKVCW
jgi:hypothetical protein